VRAILDTNILVAGLFWHGRPHQLLERVREGSLTLISSPTLFAELEEVLGRAKFDSVLLRSHTSRTKSLDEVRRLAEVLDPPPLPEPICRDPDDDHVLAVALAAQVDFIVTGDQDLLVLNAVQGIPILTPAQALAHLAREP
jgi:putative PIN family toxin of toxin-antitoxin system